MSFSSAEAGPGKECYWKHHPSGCSSSCLSHFTDWASLELSPSVESCGCGLGPSPVRLGLEKGTATHSSILAWRIPWTV